MSRLVLRRGTLRASKRGAKQSIDMSKEQNKNRALMDEDGIRIADGVVHTPEGDYPLADIAAAEVKTHKQIWGPFLLASLGTINLVAAVQTRFWGDWLAAIVMLAGGLLWRRLGTRYILVLTIGGEKVDAWHARTRAQAERALEAVRDRLG